MKKRKSGKGLVAQLQFHQERMMKEATAHSREVISNLQHIIVARDDRIKALDQELVERAKGIHLLDAMTSGFGSVEALLAAGLVQEARSLSVFMRALGVDRMRQQVERT